jgi:hypothetical protein
MAPMLVIDPNKQHVALVRHSLAESGFDVIAAARYTARIDLPLT